MTVPKPQRTSAVLWSNGAGKPTLHRYIGTYETVIAGPDGTAWEHIYECEVTGAQRRWGLVHRPPTSFDRSMGN